MKEGNMLSPGDRMTYADVTTEGLEYLVR